MDCEAFHQKSTPVACISGPARVDAGRPSSLGRRGKGGVFPVKETGRF
jgi:hypothetical protein